MICLFLSQEEARYEEAVLVEMEPSKKKKKRKREKTDIRKTKKMEEDDGDDRTRDERKAAAQIRFSFGWFIRFGLDRVSLINRFVCKLMLRINRY